MSDLSGRSDGVGPASPSANAVAGAARSLQFASIGVPSRFPLVAAKGRAAPFAPFRGHSPLLTFRSPVSFLRFPSRFFDILIPQLRDDRPQRRASTLSTRTGSEAQARPPPQILQQARKRRLESVMVPPVGWGNLTCSGRNGTKINGDKCFNAFGIASRRSIALLPILSHIGPSLGMTQPASQRPATAASARAAFVESNARKAFGARAKGAPVRRVRFCPGSAGGSCRFRRAGRERGPGVNGGPAPCAART